MSAKLFLMGGLALVALCAVILVMRSSFSENTDNAPVTNDTVHVVGEAPDNTTANPTRPKELSAQAQARVKELQDLLNSANADKPELEWILAHQEPDGSWRGGDSDPSCNLMVTALAGMAILNNKHIGGAKAWKALDRSANWILSQKDQLGSSDADVRSLSVAVLLLVNCLNAHPSNEAGWTSSTTGRVRGFLADSCKRLCELQQADGRWGTDEKAGQGHFTSLCCYLALGYANMTQPIEEAGTHVRQGAVWFVPLESLQKFSSWNNTRIKALFPDGEALQDSTAHHEWRNRLVALCVSAFPQPTGGAELDWLEALLQSDETGKGAAVISPTDYDLLAMLSRWSMLENNRHLDRYVAIQRGLYDRVVAQMNKERVWDEPVLPKDGFDGIAGRGVVGQTALACMILRGYQEALWSQIQRYRFENESLPDTAKRQ